MSNFVFSSATAAITAGTLDLSSGNYYAHLVTAAPITSNVTVAGLTLPSISGYVATPLTGLIYTPTKWTFDSFTFPRYVFVTAPVGVVICQQLSIAPASTDRVICYSDFSNSIGQTINLAVGSYVINLTFGASGAISFDYRYQYSSGAYANTEPFSKGIIYLIGSQNNTIAFAKPPSNRLFCFYAVLKDVSQRNGESFIDRSSATYNESINGIIFDFKTNLIKLGDVGIFPSAYNAASSMKLYGSNNSSVLIDISNDDNWTEIGTITSLTTNSWNLITSMDSTTYWQYLRLKPIGGYLNLNEVEFYNSSILSSTSNFV